MSNKKIKTCKVELDEITSQLAESFDYNFTGESFFEIPKFEPPEDFSVGLVLGNSGSGKSSILETHFSIAKNPSWNPNKSIASHFDSFEESCEKLFSTGLSSIPTMCRPFHVLSNGEKYRAYVARVLKSNIAIDEFTSVVNRETAYGICVAIRKYINKKKLKNIVFASCHFDIADWLEPDWIFNTNNNEFSVNGFSLEKFPKLGEFTIK